VPIVRAEVALRVQIDEFEAYIREDMNIGAVG
jgi:hypothetical protein